MRDRFTRSATEPSQQADPAEQARAELEAKISIDEIMIEVSNRHIHLSQADLDSLFGEGYKMTFLRSLAGFPDEIADLVGYATEVVLDVVNPKTGKKLDKVRVLGPVRPDTQVGELLFQIPQHQSAVAPPYEDPRAGRPVAGWLHPAGMLDPGRLDAGKLPASASASSCAP